MAAEPELYDAAPAASETTFAEPISRLEPRSCREAEIEPQQASPDGGVAARSKARFDLAVVGVIALAQLAWVGLLGYLVLELVLAV